MATILRGKIYIVFSTLFISLFTFLVFSNTLDNGFVNYDDNKIVCENNLVKELSWENTKEIFSHFTLTQYFPLVIFSHSVEYAIAGFDPWLYHLNNLVLHILNCLLFFWLIHILSGSVSASIVGALLFGIHPLHVESVAWIAERRDTLSTFFFFGALISYCYYITEYRLRYFLLSLFLFIFSLLSKQTVVTLPILLYLFDYRYSRRFDKRAILEKIPFFIFSIIFALSAIIGNQFTGGLGAKGLVPITDRVLVACRSIIFYLEKTLLPTGLSVTYPYPNEVSALDPNYFISLILLGIITISVAYSIRYTRQIAFGGLFFLITLLPVLDIIPKTGTDFAADRYMYLPSIGLFYLAGLGCDRLFSINILKERIKRAALYIFPIVVFGFFSILTYERNDIWQDSGSLWKDTISKYPESVLAHNNLGVFYQKKGLTEAAFREFQRALELNPGYADIHNNLGLYYWQKGDYRKAIASLKHAIEIRPDFAEAFNSLGICYHGLGLFNEAISYYQKGLNLQPDSAVLHNNLGISYMEAGKYDEAAEEYRTAIAIDSDFAMPHENLGVLFSQTGMFREAIWEYKIALSLEPENGKVHYELAVEYYFEKEYGLAVRHCDKAIELGYMDVDSLFLEHLEPHREPPQPEEE
ncbi:MAG: tetratricopeptide repeat protein [Deltaproteobacteria bacterium]|nr:tetratricopeptide repeat protein [Deltaproteobacteria bacterium]